MSKPANSSPEMAGKSILGRVNAIAAEAAIAMPPALEVDVSCDFRSVSGWSIMPRDEDQRTRLGIITEQMKRAARKVIE